MTGPIVNTDADILNVLIGVTLDSAESYEASAENASELRVKELFARRGLERRQIVHDLQDFIRKLGGEAEDEGSIAAKTRRHLIDLKTAVAGNDEKAATDEVGRNEDQVRAYYEAALGNADLSSEARLAVERAYISVKTRFD